jgi:hypothetical protein
MFSTPSFLRQTKRFPAFRRLQGGSRLPETRELKKPLILLLCVFCQRIDIRSPGIQKRELLAHAFGFGDVDVEDTVLWHFIHLTYYIAPRRDDQAVSSAFSVSSPRISVSTDG